MSWYDAVDVCVAVAENRYLEKQKRRSLTQLCKRTNATHVRDYECLKLCQAVSCNSLKQEL